ncbi:MAG: PepSY-associated TM helix domain-containing protein [Myxococcota bacterium]
MKEANKRAYRMHMRFGAPLVLLFFAICFSGTVAVVERDLVQWEKPTTWSARLNDSITLDPIVAQAVAEPSTKGRVRAWPDDEHPTTEVGYSTPDGFRRHYVDRQTGAVLADSSTRLIYRIVQLHRNLLASGVLHVPGRLLVGLCGLMFLIMLSTGLWQHRSFRALVKTRWPRKPGARAVTLHRLSGLALLPFSAGLAITGAVLGLTLLLVGLGAQVGFDGDRDAAFEALGAQLGVKPPPDDIGPETPSRSVDATLAEHRDPSHGVVLIDVAHHGHAAASVTLQEVDHPWHITGHTRSREVSLVDGRLSSTVHHGPNRTAAASVILSLTPLHYATYGNAVVRWLYFAAGLALCAMIVGGLEVWRHRARGSRAARRCLAGCYGLVAATMLAGVVSRVLPPGNLDSAVTTVTLLGLWLAASVAFERSFVHRPRAVGSSVRLGFALVSLIVVAGSSLGWSWATRPTSVLVYDAVLLALGVVLLAFEKRARGSALRSSSSS